MSSRNTVNRMVVRLTHAQSVRSNDIIGTVGRYIRKRISPSCHLSRSQSIARSGIKRIYHIGLIAIQIKFSRHIGTKQGIPGQFHFVGIMAGLDIQREYRLTVSQCRTDLVSSVSGGIQRPAHNSPVSR